MAHGRNNKKMDVILKKDVPNLGKAGEVKKVSDGYAHNYLLPQKIAVMATAAAVIQLQQNQEAALKQKQRSAAMNQNVLEKIKNAGLNFTGKANAEGKMFAAVTKEDVAEKLEQMFKIKLSAKNIILEQPIKHLGQHRAEVCLNNEKIEIFIEVKSNTNDQN